KLLEFAATEPMLTTSPAEHQAERGLRVVDPSLGVFVNNDTNSKIGLFRRVFAALDLDTEELVFSFRPTASETEGSSDAEPSIKRVSKYSTLTTFLDTFTEATVSTPSMYFTSELAEEVLQEFRRFHGESWLQELKGQALAQYAATTPASDI